MAELLTNREMEIFRLALIYRQRYNDACPEVGLGPTTFMIAESLANELSFSIDEDDLAEMCESISGS